MVPTRFHPVILESEITCPECGFKQVESMPTDGCQFFYECKGCGQLLRPKPGNCCVFCSHGTVPCTTGAGECGVLLKPETPLRKR